MPNLLQLYLFSVASLAILLMPGPAVLYVAAQGISRGRIAGIVAALGLELGTVFHVAITAFSLSTLPLNSALFSLLRCFGAIYLIYLGVHHLLSAEKLKQPKMSTSESLKKTFWRGVAIELLNPKTMLFFFAFLPQFANATQGHIASQILIFGFLFVGLATVIDLLYAILAASVGHGLKGKRQFVTGQRYIESSVYVGLGIATALSGSGG